MKSDYITIAIITAILFTDDMIIAKIRKSFSGKQVPDEIYAALEFNRPHLIRTVREIEQDGQTFTITPDEIAAVLRFLRDKDQ